MQKKIGILTWHNHGNFGGSLQAYALSTFLQNRGFDAVVIDYDKYCGSKCRKIFEKPLKFLVGSLIEAFDQSYRCPYSFTFRRFEYTYLKETSPATNRNELERIISDIDFLICGSDQIWAPNVFDSVYMFDFSVGKQAKKIAYAPSIGLNELPKAIALQYQRYLSDFSAVSIRETKGQEILQQQCNIHAEVVLDPTLLLDRIDYKPLEKEVKGINGPFVFCYFLNQNNCYQASVCEALKGYNLNIVGVSKKKTDSEWVHCMNYIGPREFLWLIHHAAYVFTDSYHGTIFSLLYHKNFYTLKRFKSGEQVDQNSRLEQLKLWFDIGDRIIEPKSVPPITEQIDYFCFERALFNARKISISYLMEALESDENRRR